MTYQPKIGVSVSTRSGWRIFPLIRLNLWLAGARGVRWDARRDADLSAVDGLIIGGGDDISPALYGGDIKMSARLDPARDAFERHIATSALQRNIPVLGICRGAQMLNIALGGSLHQDAWKEFGADRTLKTILPRRVIQPLRGSHLAKIAGTEKMRVNALHTQSVRDLGDGLRVSAKDASGMIQAVERIREPFALGVQWHPEHLFYARRQRALFAALTAAAKAYALARPQKDAVLRHAAR